jgi:alpha-beta hydrolase superfamily lysophospholipase
MTPSPKADYAVLDRPEVLAGIFHPRPEWGGPSSTGRDKDHMITVAPDVKIGARFHMTAAAGVNILFFHGNGEIVADYDELAPLYNRLGVNFLAADYRGYGRSGGTPTVSAMMADSHMILAYVQKWLQANAYNGPLVVMGRSLGSAPALELAAAHADAVAGLIVESGFARATPLLRLLGVDVARIGFEESKGFGNADKIRRYTGPTLVIHAEHDHIIPFSDGQALFDASGAAQKRLLCIEGANHNDIFQRGLPAYMQAVAAFAQQLGS